MIQAPSEQEKVTAFILSQGLTNGNLAKVALLTQKQAGYLFMPIGSYNVLTWSPTLREIHGAIDLCIKSGMEVIILDSISLLGFSIGLPCFPTGNSFTNWNKIT
jgi:hypothetical protein